MSIVISGIALNTDHRWQRYADGSCGVFVLVPTSPSTRIRTASNAKVLAGTCRAQPAAATREDKQWRNGYVRLHSPSHHSGLCRRQMLAHRIPAEAKLQPDLDVGAALGVELLSTPEIIAGEASLAAGWWRGLAARSADGGLSDPDLGSDLAGRHAGGLKAQDLLLLRRADRTAGRLADTAGCSGLACFRRRRYASRARLRSNLTRDEALTEGEQG